MPVLVWGCYISTLSLHKGHQLVRKFPTQASSAQMISIWAKQKGTYIHTYILLFCHLLYFLRTQNTEIFSNIDDAAFNMVCLVCGLISKICSVPLVGALR